MATSAPKPKSPLPLVRAILQEQIAGLAALSEMLGDDFNRALELIMAASDQMVVTGIGKSGLIARKAAATLSSTGTPAMFMHPVEGVHGDLGAVGPGSILLALSKSGQTA
ncbi:MAG: SIS domain-containing protein, partial [Phycisphaerae bacterium]